MKLNVSQAPKVVLAAWMYAIEGVNCGREVSCNQAAIEC
jgi:hypothetical protein